MEIFGGVDRDSKRLICFNELNLADLYISKKEYDKAISLAHSNLEICQKEDFRNLERQCFRLFGKCAFEQNNFVDSEDYFRKYVKISNEVGLPLEKWFVSNGFTDPGIPWKFPPNGPYSD